MSKSHTWQELKKKGNSLYGLCHYSEALDNYTKAIELFKENSDDGDNSAKAELAKLYSNRSVTMVKLAFKNAGIRKATDMLEQGLSDAFQCLKLDPGFEKAYHRVGDALCKLGREKEAVEYVDKLIACHKKTHKKDDSGTLIDLMKQCKYHSHKKKESQNWHLIKYKTNCFVVDPNGAGDLVEIKAAVLLLNNKASFLVRPGKYRVSKDLMVVPNKEFDIVADVTDDSEDVEFFTEGKVFEPGACHIFVVLGKLSLQKVTLKQMTDHPELHAVCGNMGATIEMTDVKAYSKCSASVGLQKSSIKINGCDFIDACGAIVISSNSKADIKNCRIIANARIGIELRDGGWADVEDTEIVNCGCQGIATHAEAKGFLLNRCVIHNNSKHLDGEASISVASGNAIMKDTQISGNKKGGIMISNNAHATIEKCSIAGGQYGIGCSLKGRGYIHDNHIKKVKFGISILFNQKGEVVMENNKIESNSYDIMLASEDSVPRMIGTKHTYHRGIDKSLLKDNSEPILDAKKRQLKKDKLQPGSVKFMACGGCKIAWYCSRKCQKKGWSHLNFEFHMILLNKKYSELEHTSTENYFVQCITGRRAIQLQMARIGQSTKENAK